MFIITINIFPHKKSFYVHNPLNLELRNQFDYTSQKFVKFRKTGRNINNGIHSSNTRRKCFPS